MLKHLDSNKVTEYKITNDLVFFSYVDTFNMAFLLQVFDVSNDMNLLFFVYVKK